MSVVDRRVCRRQPDSDPPVDRVGPARLGERHDDIPMHLGGDVNYDRFLFGVAADDRWCRWPMQPDFEVRLLTGRTVMPAEPSPSGVGLTISLPLHASRGSSAHWVVADKHVEVAEILNDLGDLTHGQCGTYNVHNGILSIDLAKEVDGLLDWAFKSARQHVSTYSQSIRLTHALAAPRQTRSASAWRRDPSCRHREGQCQQHHRRTRQRSSSEK